VINETIFAAQDYLTIEKDEVRKRIVNIEALNKTHNVQEIIMFLKDYLKGKERALKNLIMIDKTQRRVDETVVAMFRLSMAIKTLESEICVINPKRKEAKKLVQFKPRTEKSGRIPKRYSRCNRSARQWEDSHNDGEDRNTGQGIQRAA